jgi:hypothetical protein
MEANEKIFDQRTFDDQPLQCPKCGWKGKGLGHPGCGADQEGPRHEQQPRIHDEHGRHDAGCA